MEKSEEETINKLTMEESDFISKNLTSISQEAFEANINETLPNVNSSGPVTKDVLFDEVFVTCLWIEGVIGMYIMLQLIKYLQNKPPNLQSQLDIMYQVMLESWIIDCFWLTITYTSPLFFGLPWELALVAAWSRVFFRICSTLIMVIGSFYRLILIYRPDMIEGISDSTMKLSLW